MRTHLTVVAWIHIVGGGLGLCAAAVLGIFFLGLGGFVAATDHQALPALGMLGGFGFLVFWLVALASIPSLIAGVGLLGRANWARILALALAFFDLLNFPIGTAISAYTLYVLFHPETALMFERRLWYSNL